MRDTAVVLSPEQQGRMIPAYSLWHDLWPPWEIGALAPAGGISSTASDMLTYLQAQIQAGSPAIRLSHELQTDLIGGRRIALAWVYDPDAATFWHNGAISAHTGHAVFNPKPGY